MLRRHLDVPVYGDSITPLRCPHCSKRMDALGDHATHCKTGFGMIHRHDTVRNQIATHAFRAAGLACTLQVPFLVPNTNHRPADILVQPVLPPPGMLPDKPTAYDVTIRSPFTTANIRQSSRRPAAAAEAGELSKHQTLRRTLREALRIPTDAGIPTLNWHFEAISFDTLGACSSHTMAVIETLALKISHRSHCAYGTAKLRLQQRISYAIWSSVATAILARMPSHTADFIENVRPHAVIWKVQNRATRVHDSTVRTLCPISRHDTCKVPDFGVLGTKVDFWRVVQICISPENLHFARTVIGLHREYCKSIGCRFECCKSIGQLFVHLESAMLVICLE